MTQTMADITNAWRGTNQGIQLKNGGSSGFDAIMAGRNTYGLYSFLNQNTYFWTSTQYGISNAWRRCLDISLTSVGRFNNFPKAYGLSVRCLK